MLAAVHVPYTGVVTEPRDRMVWGCSDACTDTELYGCGMNADKLRVLQLKTGTEMSTEKY